MQGKKSYTEKLFVCFRLSEQIPSNNKYRRLKELLDLDFVYKATAHLYGDTGQSSIDPVVFFKLLIASFIEGITSDRELMEHCSLRMDIRYFLGYDIDEPLPWHSTVSRTRRLYPEGLFDSVFNQILAMCVETGLVSGSTQCVDSAISKANASKESLVDWGQVKEFLDAGRELNAVDSNDNDGSDSGGCNGDGASRPQETGAPQAKEGVNRRKRSLTDPDAKVVGRSGRTTLGYFCNTSVDTANHVITHIQADHGNQKDSDCLIDIVKQTRNRLRKYGLALEQVVADTGYSSGKNHAWLEQNEITGWIPVHGGFKPHREEGFVHDPVQDVFTCPVGNQLSLKKEGVNARGNRYKIYAAAKEDCQSCPLKTLCFKGKSHKTIWVSAYHEEYHRAHARQKTSKGKQMARLRSSRVEPVLGTLMNVMGLRHLRVRGMTSVNKVMKMAGAVYNLKKLLEHYRKLKPAAQKRKVLGQNPLKTAKKRLIAPSLPLISTIQHPTYKTIFYSI